MEKRDNEERKKDGESVKKKNEGKKSCTKGKRMKRIMLRRRGSTVETKKKKNDVVLRIRGALFNKNFSAKKRK